MMVKRYRGLDSGIGTASHPTTFGDGTVVLRQEKGRVRGKSELRSKILLLHEEKQHRLDEIELEVIYDMLGAIRCSVCGECISKPRNEVARAWIEGYPHQCICTSCSEQAKTKDARNKLMGSYCQRCKARIPRFRLYELTVARRHHELNVRCCRACVDVISVIREEFHRSGSSLIQMKIQSDKKLRTIQESLDRKDQQIGNLSRLP